MLCESQLNKIKFTGIWHFITNGLDSEQRELNSPLFVVTYKYIHCVSNLHIWSMIKQCQQKQKYKYILSDILVF